MGWAYSSIWPWQPFLQSVYVFVGIDSLFSLSRPSILPLVQSWQGTLKWVMEQAYLASAWVLRLRAVQFQRRVDWGRWEAFCLSASCSEYVIDERRMEEGTISN